MFVRLIKHSAAYRAFGLIQPEVFSVLFPSFGTPTLSTAPHPTGAIICGKKMKAVSAESLARNVVLHPHDMGSEQQ